MSEGAFLKLLEFRRAGIDVVKVDGGYEVGIKGVGTLCPEKGFERAYGKGVDLPTARDSLVSLMSTAVLDKTAAHRPTKEAPPVPICPIAFTAS